MYRSFGTSLHISTLVAGEIRGNHFHRIKLEVLIIQSTGPWSFHWRSPENDSSEHRVFASSQTVVIKVDRKCAHAVENTGNGVLQIIGLSNEVHTGLDSFKSVVTE